MFVLLRQLCVYVKLASRLSAEISWEEIFSCIIWQMQVSEFLHKKTQCLSLYLCLLYFGYLFFDYTQEVAAHRKFETKHIFDIFLTYIWRCKLTQWKLSTILTIVWSSNKYQYLLWCKYAFTHTTSIGLKLNCSLVWNEALLWMDVSLTHPNRQTKSTLPSKSGKMLISHHHFTF